MSKAELLQNAYHRRNVAKISILHIKSRLENEIISFDPNELEYRIEMLNMHCEKLMECQSNIEDIDRTDMTRVGLEDLIAETKAMIKSFLARKNTIAESTSTASKKSVFAKMNVAKFKGQYSEYKNFMDKFESAVNNDPTITDIEKFKHLLNCLTGETLDMTKAYQLSVENYPKTLANLKQVYECKYLKLFGTIAKLFELPKMKQSSAAELRAIVDSVAIIYDALLTLGDDKDITNALIIQLVMQKVDADTRAKWEKQLDYDKLPLWRDCEAVLNEHYQHLLVDEAVNANSSKSENSDNAQKQNSAAETGKSDSMATSFKEQFCRHCKSYEYYLNNAGKAANTLTAQQKINESAKMDVHEDIFIVNSCPSEQEVNTKTVADMSKCKTIDEISDNPTERNFNHGQNNDEELQDLNLNAKDIDTVGKKLLASPSSLPPLPPGNSLATQTCIETPNVTLTSEYQKKSAADITKIHQSLFNLEQSMKELIKIKMSGIKCVPDGLLTEYIAKLHVGVRYENWGDVDKYFNLDTDGYYIPQILAHFPIPEYVPRTYEEFMEALCIRNGKTHYSGGSYV